MVLLRVHSVQSVINKPTQLSGRGFSYILFLYFCLLSQLYVFGAPKYKPGRVIWKINIWTQIGNETLNILNSEFVNIWSVKSMNNYLFEHWSFERINKLYFVLFFKINPGSLTRGRLLGERGCPSGKPLTPMSPPRVRLSGIGASYSWGVNDNI